MENNPTKRQPSGQSASNQTRKQKRVPYPKQDWQTLSEALLAPARLPEDELDAFKHIWNSPRQVLKEAIWDKVTRTYNATGKRVVIGLTQRQKDRIDATANKYLSVEGYRLEVLFSSGDRRLYRENFPFKQAYRDAKELYRRGIHAMIDFAFDAPEMKSAARAEKIERIDKMTREFRKAMLTALGVSAEAHRPLVKEDQHREWYRMLYTGRKLKEIAEETGEDESHIQKSVARYRKRREPVQWVLRYLIYHQQNKRT